MRCRAGCFVAILLFPTLAACDDEPAQRAAFKDFLQTRIVSRSGIHIPVMHEDTARTFGPYARDYQVILDFNAGLNMPVLSGFEAIRNRVRDLNGIVASRAELAALQDAVPDVIAVNRRQLAAANATHAAMKHPPDLKPVYDQAFERIVTQPGELFAEMLPLLQAHLGAMVRLADFITAHASQVEVYAVTAEVKDPALKEELRRLLGALHDRDTETEALRRRFQALVGGG